MKIGAISLGCDKNRVDTEKMLARLLQAGHTLVGSEEEADVIIINTCAFIDSAKEEAIDEILQAIAVKQRYPDKRIVVTGCLSKRYGEELQKEFCEVDAFLGVADYDLIVKVVSDITDNAANNGENGHTALKGADGTVKNDVNCGGGVLCCEGKDGFFADRVLTTPYHYAYLKIADGCDNRCTYCAIPSIRGKYRSESMQDLLAEAKKLADDGVKELILVAQDVTRYGIDFDGKPHLFELVRELEKLDFEWIRLLYLEPEMIDDGFVEFVKNEPKVVKYMDIPLQHVDSGVLKRMNRHTTEESTRALVKKVKDAGIAVRTTFICGFPGESEEAHEKLKRFVKEAKLDYAGFFAYSREEGTPADRLDGHLDDGIKAERVRELEEIQYCNMLEKNKSFVGKTVTVLYDDIDYDRQAFVGRMPTQTPDIDSVVYFGADCEVHIGNLYSVEITAVDGVNLIGRVI